MILFKKAEQLKHHLSQVYGHGKTTGFIPTMGALHEGHVELIRQSLDRGNETVCSIFVNPTQFNNLADFEKYPKTLESDMIKLEAAGVQALFVPDVEDIYPDGTTNLESFKLGYLETILEGSSRPGHFQGVCQVMKRLLTIVNPDQLFMGQKDYQQCMVVSWLLEQMNLKTEMITVPTVREPGGLAMSSRNLRLSAGGKVRAGGIYETLQSIKASLKAGDVSDHLASAKLRLESEGFKVDYVQLAEASNLRLVSTWDGHTPLVCVIAVFLEDVRLIDNMIVTG